jgi:hypothetical protein
MVRKMPTWKYTDKEVSKAKAEESLKAVKGACFGCDTHNQDCPIAGAAGAISEMLGCETLSVREQNPRPESHRCPERCKIPGQDPPRI